MGCYSVSVTCLQSPVLSLDQYGSLFRSHLYQGVEAGDIFMSLIQTCIINKVNPAKYLAAILENKEHVVKYPSEWMPWNYTDAQISLKKMVA